MRAWKTYDEKIVNLDFVDLIYVKNRTCYREGGYGSYREYAVKAAVNGTQETVDLDVFDTEAEAEKYMDNIYQHLVRE